MATMTLAICARNASEIIGRCLESIQRQTVAPDHVLVAVDDADDPTAAAAREFGAEVIVTHSTGLYEARNAVLNACTTEYLAFTDADCTLVPDWVQRAKAVLDANKDIAAGTGRHPPNGKRTLASWLHHMWYVVETERTGETGHVIGGNSYFRTQALRDVGGWLNLRGHSAAEDMYISEALRRAAYRVWFEEAVAAEHAYETRLVGLWRKAVMMGRDIVVMLRAAGWYESLWWYTLAIPVMALVFLAGIALALVVPVAGLVVAAAPLFASYLFLAIRFRNLAAAFPRWLARWVLIWPYSWGILQGLAARIPDEARR